MSEPRAWVEVVRIDDCDLTPDRYAVQVRHEEDLAYHPSREAAVEHARRIAAELGLPFAGDN